MNEAAAATGRLHQTLVHRLGRCLGRYLACTRQPLACVAFAAPLLVFYEVGVMALPAAARNGADVWMRASLGAVGLSGYFLLPLLTVGVLLAWHHTTGRPWRLPRGVVLGMAGESALLGALLFVIARSAAGLASAGFPAPGVAELSLAADTPLMDKARLWLAEPAITRLATRVVQYVGAGLYEEVLFRLLLLPTLIAALAAWVKPARPRVAIAVAATSLLFAAAHHAGPHGEAFVAGVFVFRTLAGVAFAMLFLRRGFGIAIGAHAAYDLIAGVGSP
ncbi:MAG: CPBP family glutamic-type intramembrane protease [Planctomycetota bacterium]